MKEKDVDATVPPVRQWVSFSGRVARIGSAPPPRRAPTPEPVESLPIVIAPAPDPTASPETRGELQQSAMLSRDMEAGMGYETNMAAFEAQDPRGHRPQRAKVGYASVKGSFRR